MVVRSTQQYAEFLTDGDGDVRVTSHYVEVLTNGSGVARVTSQYIEVLTDLPYPGTNELEFVETVTVQTILNISVAQELELVESLDVRGPKYFTISQDLNLVQMDDGGHKNPNHQFPGNVLELVDKVYRGQTFTVAQTLELVQEALRVLRVRHLLNLVQSVTVGKGGLFEQTLDLVEVLSRQGLFSRSVAQMLGLSQSVTYTVEGDPCLKKSYQPFVGSTDGEFTPPSTTAPTLSTDTLTLTHPYVSPTTTLILRNPVIGERDTLAFNRINRPNRGGGLIVFSDPDWPKTQTLSLQVDVLSQAKAQALVAFLATSLGQEIGLLDWEGRQWRGLITNPDLVITHVNRGGRSIELDFQGELA